jgi:hypothetical protein
MGAPVPYNRFVMPRAYAPSATGAPLAGAQLYFYASGTTTPQNTYSEDTLSIPNPNPVLADQSGTFPDIFLQNLNYRVLLTDSNNAEIWTADPVAPFNFAQAAVVSGIVLECVFDGNGAVIPAGKTRDLVVPMNCIITTAYLQADQPGNIQIDVWENSFTANNPPSVVNSICAADLPTLVSAQSMVDSTLTGWTTAISSVAYIRFSVVSCSVITSVTLTLVCVPKLL